MTCEQAQQELVVAWESRKCPGAALRAHLEACVHCNAEHELWEEMERLPEELPSSALRARFYAMLDGHEARSPWWLSLWTLLAPPRWMLQTAGAVVLVAAAFVAGRTTRPPAQPEPEMAQLRNEVRDLREMVTLSLLRQTSASERLRGVTYSTVVDRPDPKIIDALMIALRSDPSPDVRLSALDALQRYGKQPDVRQGLLEALTVPQSPLVQVSLIDSLVTLREKGSTQVLETIRRDQQVNELVRKRAEQGIEQLRQVGVY